MNRPKTRASGMTLIEMLTAITILMILMAILAEVFYQAVNAATKGKALSEIYQAHRALRNLIAKDISGAMIGFFESAENGLVSANSSIYDLPPGPYHSALFGAPFTAADMRRMLMGGSDYLVFASGSASSSGKAGAKFFYVLREKGQLIRVVHGDTNYNQMNYTYDAIDQGKSGDMDAYEEWHVVAEGVERIKFSFLDRGRGPVSDDAYPYANGVWLEDWNWFTKPYLPAAVKVELQLVDHLWKLADDDRISNRAFDPQQPDDLLRASEQFDPDDGEAFTFILDVPLGLK